MNLQQYLEEQFKHIDLFTNSYLEPPFSLHIELEKNLYQYTTSEDLNETYFNNVYEKAIAIFKDIFDNNDELFLVVHVRKNLTLQNKIRKTAIFDKYVRASGKIHDLNYRKVTIKSNEEEVIEYSALLKTNNILYKPLIQAICNQDFQCLKPRLQDKYTYYPEIFFIHKHKNIILNIYDDRGLIILLNNLDDWKLFKERYK